MQDNPIDDSDSPTTSSVSDASAPEAAAIGVLDRDPYGIKLEVFEGPLDLLLYLIRKSEIDIYDIPVAIITTDYLSYLNRVQLQDLEQAGEFILMAATLMRIKSQMLLPRQIELAEGEEDPRQELVRRLLEYQQFKEIAEWLADQGIEQRDIFPSSASSAADDLGAESVHPVSLFDLLSAYKDVLEHVSDTVVHRIVEEEISIEKCILLVMAELDRHERLRFFGLVEGKGKIALVATFIGVLELLKSQRIRVQQAKPFDEIWIERQPQGTDGVDGTGHIGLPVTVSPERGDQPAMETGEDGDGGGFRFE